MNLSFLDILNYFAAAPLEVEVEAFGVSALALTVEEAEFFLS